MPQFLVMLYRKVKSNQPWIYIMGLKTNTEMFSFTCIPIHSPLLKESWLVSSFALRWLICLSLARSLAWAEANKCV